MRVLGFKDNYDDHHDSTALHQVLVHLIISAVDVCTSTLPKCGPADSVWSPGRQSTSRNARHALPPVLVSID